MRTRRVAAAAAAALGVWAVGAAGEGSDPIVYEMGEAIQDDSHLSAPAPDEPGD